jgi:hypothetical protein
MSAFKTSSMYTSYNAQLKTEWEQSCRSTSGILKPDLWLHFFITLLSTTTVFRPRAYPVFSIIFMQKDFIIQMGCIDQMLQSCRQFNAWQTNSLLHEEHSGYLNLSAQHFMKKFWEVVFCWCSTVSYQLVVASVLAFWYYIFMDSKLMEKPKDKNIQVVQK